MPDLVARPLTATALSDLLDRKPHLLPALAVQILPPPCPAFDPADDLGMGALSLPTPKDCRDALSRVLTAVARGDLSPAEAVTIARRIEARLCADRRLKRLQRQPAHQTGPVRGRR